MISREEAIGILSNQAQNAAIGLDVIPELEKEMTQALMNDIEALDMAIEALEKRIPKKPTIWGDGYADGMLVYDMWDCPNCEKSYEIDYDHYDHCPDCGQAIDWSDNE